MFNLLVSSGGWADDRDTMPLGRAFEYTDDRLFVRFKPKGKFDFAALSQLPALFLAESSTAKDKENVPGVFFFLLNRRKNTGTF